MTTRRSRPPDLLDVRDAVGRIEAALEGANWAVQEARKEAAGHRDEVAVLRTRVYELEVAARSAGGYCPQCGAPCPQCAALPESYGTLSVAVPTDLGDRRQLKAALRELEPLPPQEPGTPRSQRRPRRVLRDGMPGRPRPWPYPGDRAGGT